MRAEHVSCQYARIGPPAPVSSPLLAASGDNTKSLSTEDCYIFWLRRYMTPRIREIACDVFIHSVHRVDSCPVLPPQTIKLHSHHIHISTEECNRTGRISCNVHPRSKNAWG